jgi:DNA-binding MarR family transcriptional regulator
METNNIEELARIASGVKLAAGYKEALASQPDNIKNSSRMQKIIAYLEQNETATLKDIAMALYNRPDTASVNQLVKALKQTGIIEDTGLVAPKQVKASVNAPGVKGRPKVSNDEIKMLGGGALRKFAKGETDFTPEEIDFITQLYNAATAISESELAEVSKEEIAENVSDLAVRFTSEYTENPDKYFEKGIADEIEEIDGQQVRAIVGYYIPEGGANQGDEEVEDIGYIYSKSGQDLSSYAGEDFEDAFNNSLRINEINIDRWNKLAGLI